MQIPSGSQSLNQILVLGGNEDQVCSMEWKTLNNRVIMACTAETAAS